MSTTRYNYPAPINLTQPVAHYELPAHVQLLIILTIMAELTLTDDQKLNKALQDQITTLTSEKQALSAENDKLKADCEGIGSQLLKAQTTAVDLGKQLEVANLAKTKAEGELTQAMTVVTDLKTKLAAKTDESASLGSVKVGKDTYELTSDFFYKGEEVTLQSLKENADLAAELVAEKIGNLRKVVK